MIYPQPELKHGKSSSALVALLQEKTSSFCLQIMAVNSNSNRTTTNGHNIMQRVEEPDRDFCDMFKFKKSAPNGHYNLTRTVVPD